MKWRENTYVRDDDGSVGGFVSVEPRHHPGLQRGGCDDKEVVFRQTNHGTVVLVTAALVLHPRIDHLPIRSVHVV